MNRADDDDASFLEREAEAGAFLLRAMELMPQHADSYRLLSGLRADEMRWEEAAVLARRAARLNPPHSDPYGTMPAPSVAGTLRAPCLPPGERR